MTAQLSQPSSMPSNSDRPIGIKRLGLAGGLLLALLCTMQKPIAAQPLSNHPAFDVEVVGAAQRHAAPGEVVTVALRITNSGRQARAFTVALEAPEQWPVVLTPDTTHLEAARHRIRFITVQVPHHTEATAYALRAIVQEAETSGNRKAIALRVDVQVARSLALHLDQVPRFVRAGEVYSVAMAISNTGNTAATVDLTMKSTHGTPGTYPQKIVLPSGEVHRLSIDVLMTEDVRAQVKEVFTVVAEWNGAPDVTEQASESVTIVPKGVAKVRRGVTLPLEARVHVLGDGHHAWSQVELEGRGPLFANRTDQLDVLLRLPDLRSAARMGREDAVALSYTTDHFFVRLGDHRYQLTDVTERGILGRGIESQWQWHGWTLGGYALKARHTLLDHTQEAASLSYEPRVGLAIGANYIARQGQYGGQVSSITSSIPLPLRGYLNAEFAHGWNSETTQGKAGNGYKVNMAGRSPRLSYNAQFLYLDPLLPGYAGGRKQFSASGTGAPVPWLRVDASMQQRAVSLGAGFNAVRTQASYQAGMGVYHRRSNYQAALKASYFHDENQVTPLDLGYGRHSQAIRLHTSLSNPQLSLAATTVQGFLKDDEGQQGRFQEYNLRLQGGTQRIQVSTSATYRSGQTVFSAQAQQQWTLTGHLSASLSRSKLALQAGWVHVQTFSAVQNGWLRGHIEHDLPFNHKLSLQASLYRGSRVQGTTAYAITYSVPLHLPVLGHPKTPVVTGRVVDVETGNGLADVVVYIGSDVRITDQDGRFKFADTLPGPTYLFLDPQTIGTDRIATQPLPLSIMLEESNPPPIEIGVVRSARLSGRAMVYAPASQAVAPGISEGIDLTPSDPLRGVLLELSDGTERLRALTDLQGFFHFPQLRPGTWTLTVLAIDLPVHHYLAEKQVTFTLSPGEARDLHLKVLPQERKRLRIEGGTLQPHQKN